MAEAHPVGFRWVMKAKERGARVIHVDPRYGRTSQMADVYVPIRAGTDVAFLGGIIRHVIETESYFKDYVVNYTNACAIVNESFRDTEDLDGVFSGYDPQTGTYNPISWMYGGCEVNFSAGIHEHATQAFSEHTGAGMLLERLERDETLEHPRCVFSDPAPALRPLHAGDGAAHLRNLARGLQGSQHSGLQRRALARLKWLVVRDLAEIETATFWRDSPEVQSGELSPEAIQTEVFLMPAASHIEKEGTFTNTQRLVQFRDKALNPPGARARSCGSCTIWPSGSRRTTPGPTTSAIGRS
jgi:anaerobic selenocysteine-containing dehydrogenase